MSSQGPAEPFEAFELHTKQAGELLGVAQVRPTVTSDSTGEAVRMDAMQVVRAAVELADALERDARNASAARLQRAEEEARAVVAAANAEASRRLREAEVSAGRLLEQARSEATELTNAARAEVEQRLEWARVQASSVLARAQQRAI